MRKPTALVLWVVIVLLLGGNIVALQQIETDTHPSAWDPRIDTLVSFVEDKRGLDFDHPVRVRFLTDAEYIKEQTTDESDLTADETRDLTLFEGQAKALGLISGDTNLLEDINAIATGGTVAYYDHEAEEMVIRGTELTVGLRVTVVHELTHALQDQAFGLDREFESDGAQSFFDALVEGDATRIENEYVTSLDQAERSAYENEPDDGSEDALAEVAPALLQFFGAPYALGEQITALIVDEKGQRGLDRLFRTPPDSDEGLLNAFVALDGGQRVKDVSAPTLSPDEEENDSGDFGSLAWYLVLASFVDVKTALTAVDGWGGDAYVGYEKAGKSCIRIAFVGDTANDTTEMTNALNQWKAVFTENTARVTPSEGRVELDACEPDVVPAPRDGAEVALTLPVARLAFVGAVLGQAGRPLAECATRHFIAALPLEALSNPTDATQQQLFAIGQQIGQGCVTGALK
jgi:hypothetical protein